MEPGFWRFHVPQMEPPHLPTFLMDELGHK
jgi:hypothetical protein